MRWRAHVAGEVEILAQWVWQLKGAAQAHRLAQPVLENESKKHEKQLLEVRLKVTQLEEELEVAMESCASLELATHTSSMRLVNTTLCSWLHGTLRGTLLAMKQHMKDDEERCLGSSP